MLPASNQPPHYCQRGERIYLSAFLTESITLQNSEPPPQQIKIPDLPPLILCEKSKHRGVFLFQSKDNMNLKHFSRAEVQPHKLTPQPVLPAQKAQRASRLQLGLSCISLLKPQMAFYSQILLFTEECKT